MEDAFMATGILRLLQNISRQEPAATESEQRSLRQFVKCGKSLDRDA